MAYAIALSPRFAVVTLDAGDTIINLGAPHPFPVIAAEDLIVTRIRAGVRTILALNVDYAVTLLDQLPGARVTLAAGALQDDTIEIVGARPVKRVTGLLDGKKFSDTALNRELDSLTITMQEILRDIGRTMKFPVGEPGLTFSGGLAVGDTLMIGPDQTIVPGPSAADLAAVAPAAAAAVAARNFAAKWASDPEDGAPINDGVNAPDRSARHYAAKSAIAAAAAIAAADAAEGLPRVADRTALKAIDTAGATAAFLMEAGRDGTFIWTAGNLSAQVADDPLEGFYVAPASAPTGASGAWVRQATTRTPEMFGLTGGSQILKDAISFLTAEHSDARGDRFCNGERRKLQEYYDTQATPYPFKLIVDEFTNATALAKAGTVLVGMYRLNKEQRLLDLAVRFADKIIGLQWKDPSTARFGGIKLGENAGQASAFTAALAGDFLLKLYDVTGAVYLIDAALRIGTFMKVLNNPNATYSILYGETPIPQETRNGITWNGLCDQISSGDVISITATTWNIAAVPFLQRLTAITGNTSFSAVATNVLAFMQTGVISGYDFFAIYHNAAPAHVNTAWPIDTGRGFVADHAWHRQGEETGIGGSTSHSGTAQAGGAATVTLAAGASAVTNFYQFKVVEITGGTGSGQTRFIMSYNGTTKVVTVSRAWDVQPNNTSTYEIKVQANTIGTDQIEYGLTAMLEGGVAKATVQGYYNAYKAFPHIDLGSTAFGNAYQPEYSWTGYFRMRLAGDGGPACFGSYYDAQGVLVYLKSRVDPGALPEALSLSRDLIARGALLDETFDPFWSVVGSDSFLTRGTIPVAEAAAGILKAIGAYHAA